ncbi:MAG: TIGR00730 family Rossman fold protein [Nitrospinales bacterium]
MTNPLKAICVFCASSNSVDPEYIEEAFNLGYMMGQDGIDLVYGGASIGLMGSVARGVHKGGGKVVGVLPEFFKKKDIEYSDADELIVVKDMRERKAVMDQRSDGFIVLPGGVGTLEEALEILSMIQLRLTQKPLVFVNTNNFYNGLIDHLKMTVEAKFAKEETLKMFEVVPDPQSALEYLKNFTPPELHNKWI